MTAAVASATSHAGLAAIAPKVKTIEEKILLALEVAGIDGMTAYELLKDERYFGKKTAPGTVNGRLKSLEKLPDAERMIFRNGNTRITTGYDQEHEIYRLAKYATMVHPMPRYRLVQHDKVQGVIEVGRLIAKGTPGFAGSPTSKIIKRHLNYLLMKHPGWYEPEKV